MVTIPLQATASQVTRIILGNQNCVIRLYQKNEGLFFDLNSNGVDIVTCVIARNADLLVCRTYVGFVGNLMFIDTLGDTDPNYSGLTSRYNLLYLNEAETNVIV